MQTTFALAAVLTAALTAGLSAAQVLTFGDVQKMTPALADAREVYGGHPLQFVDLRVPPGPGPHPVVFLIHGGCWLSSINLDNISMLAAALKGAGIATASVEYRRVGDEGGGAPGTFDDVEAAFDRLPSWAREHRLDLSRLAIAGHSAGGHLALWLAGRRSDRIRGVFALAAVTDLEAASGKVCGNTVPRLLGATPDYARYSPIARLPLKVPTWILEGDADTIVPASFGAAYEAKAREAGDRVVRRVFPGAGHFELTVPGKAAADAIVPLIAETLRGVR
jgi:acetyl esterase/lipase